MFLRCNHWNNFLRLFPMVAIVVANDHRQRSFAQVYSTAKFVHLPSLYIPISVSVLKQGSKIKEMPSKSVTTNMPRITICAAPQYMPHHNMHHTTICGTPQYSPHHNMRRTTICAAPQYALHRNMRCTTICFTPQYVPHHIMH